VGYIQQNLMNPSAADQPFSAGPALESWNLFCSERETLLRRNLARISFFLELSRDLSAEGIDIVPLKGLDLVLRAYPSPGMRDMTDIDLLIREKDARKVMVLLETKGLKRKPDEGLTYFSADGQMQLDIILDIWYLNRLETRALWDRTEMIIYNETPVRCLHPEDFLIYHAAYSVAHRGSLSPVLSQDIEQWLNAFAARIDWSSAAGKTRRYGLIPAVYRALSYVKIPGGMPGQFHPRSLREKIKARIYEKTVTEKPRLHVSYFFTLLEYPNLRGKLKLLREKLLPTRFEHEIHYGRCGFISYLAHLFFHPFKLLFRAAFNYRT
jgi:hypothetical protein